jgi:hypothetical protein
MDAKDEALANTTEHPGTTVWPSGDASDDSTVHCRDWTLSVIGDREEEGGRPSPRGDNSKRVKIH